MDGGAGELEVRGAVGEVVSYLWVFVRVRIGFRLFDKAGRQMRVLDLVEYGSGSERMEGRSARRWKNE